MGSLDQLARQRKQGGAAAPTGGGSLDQLAHARRNGGGVSDIPTLAAPPEHHHGGHGLLHTLGHAVEQTGVDLKDVALGAPGGLVEVGKSLVNPMVQEIVHGPASPQAKKARGHLDQLAKGQVVQVKDDLHHPLRHPGLTLLDVLPFVGIAGKAVEAGALAARGGTLGEVAKAATVGVKPGTRVLRSGGLEVRGHYSRAAGARGVQKGIDAALQKGAERGVGISVGKHELSAESLLHGRMAKWMGRNERVAAAVARTPGTRVAQLGQKLKPDELRAIRLVAEEAPVERRLAAQQLRQGASKSAKETARHQERIDLTRAAMEHLTADEHGRPVFKPEATKLRKIYEQVKAASTDREHMLEQIGLLDTEAAQAAKTNTARVAAGATYEKPTPGKLGISKSLTERQRRVTSLEGRLSRSQAGRFRTAPEAEARLAKLEAEHNDALDKVAGGLFGAIDKREVAFRNRENARALRQQSSGGGASGRKSTVRSSVKDEMRARAERAIERLAESNPDHPIVQKWLARSDEIEQLNQALHPELFDKVKRRELGHVGTPTDPARHAQLEGALEVARRDLASIEKSVAARVKPTGIVGAEDIVASPDAVHIGNPVERSRVGRPKVSSTGTFGKTSKPSSLKGATGGAVTHALERNDITNIVAERHAEAVRLTTIDRARKQLAKAGTAVPRRADDIFVRTGDLVKQEKLPHEVRTFLQNPESLAALPEAERVPILQQIRDLAFAQHDWHADPEARAKFEQLATDGEGVFIPRKLAGEFAKREITVPGAAFIDQVNNAQKAGLVYLKVNYPIVQAISNTAMNMIQQGFAAPVRLTQAVKLDHAIGPELAGVVDDIMGEGAVVQAQFSGTGAVAHVSQKIAHVMSSAVDRPARRAAFLHEAHKAGFGTPAKLEQLLTDDQHAGDLAEVAQRAKEAIVDYSELGPNERAIVRRLIFVYPWQKGAVKYAGDFLRDHPVQAAVVGHLGELGTTTSNDQLGAVPSYLQGLIGVGHDRVVNPAGVNFFQTPAQIGEGLAGLASGNPAQRSAGLGFLAPAPAIVAGLLSGSDDIGRPLKGNLATKVRDLTVGQTPAAALAYAASGGRTHSVLGGRGPSKTFPGADDALWRFLLGGLYPRTFDKGALNKNAAREKTGR